MRLQKNIMDSSDFVFCIEVGFECLSVQVQSTMQQRQSRGPLSRPARLREILDRIPVGVSCTTHDNKTILMAFDKHER